MVENIRNLGNGGCPTTPQQPECLIGNRGFGITNPNGAWTYGCSRICLSCLRGDECLNLWFEWKENDTNSHHRTCNIMACDKATDVCLDLHPTPFSPTDEQCRICSVAIHNKAKLDELTNLQDFREVEMKEVPFDPWVFINRENKRIANRIESLHTEANK